METTESPTGSPEKSTSGKPTMEPTLPPVCDKDCAGKFRACKLPCILDLFATACSRCGRCLCQWG